MIQIYECLRMIPMVTNNTNKTKLFYPELSYTLVGICFFVHNELGRFARERQYGDSIEKKLKESKILYKRECAIGDSNNVADFIIEDKIAIELKAKRILIKEDYIQIQRYLQESKLRLGLLINFRDKYIKPTRIVRIDSKNKNNY